jgi:hypothetical protein
MNNLGGSTNKAFKTIRNKSLQSNIFCNNLNLTHNSEKKWGLTEGVSDVKDRQSRQPRSLRNKNESLPNKDSI